MKQLLLFFLLFIYHPIFGQKDDSFDLPNVDKSEWINPNDLPSRFSSRKIIHALPDDLINDLNSCRSKLDNIEKIELLQTSTQVYTECNCIGDFTLLKHVVHRILAKLGLDSFSPDNKKNSIWLFDAFLQLSSADIIILHRLKAEQNPDMNLVLDAKRVLETFIMKTRRIRQSPIELSHWETLLSYFPAFIRTLNIIFLIPASAMVLQHLTRISMKRFLSYILLSSFFVSSVWTWFHLYKEKQVERQARFVKFGVPKECTPEQQGIIGDFQVYLRSFISFTSVDPCLRYYKDVVIDPLFEVTPLEAISVTLATFLFRPLGILGENWAHFFTQFYSRLPLTISPFATVFLLIITLTVLMFTFGYSFRFAYGLLSLERGSHSNLLRIQNERIERISTRQSREPDETGILIRNRKCRTSSLPR